MFDLTYNPWLKARNGVVHSVPRIHSLLPGTRAVRTEFRLLSQAPYTQIFWQAPALKATGDSQQMK